jgi:hypothetical protein
LKSLKKIFCGSLNLLLHRKCLLGEIHCFRIEEESNRQLEDPDFYGNTYFKLSGVWHDVDDILREIEN